MKSKNIVIQILFWFILLITLGLGITYVINLESKTGVITGQIVPLQEHKIKLSTDIEDKRVVYTDKKTLDTYLNEIGFWTDKKLVIKSGSKIQSPPKTVEIKELRIIVTTNGSGMFDKKIDTSTSEVLTSFNYTNDEKGYAILTIFVNKTLLENSEQGDNAISYALFRSLYIINKNSSITSSDYAKLNGLYTDYFLTPGSSVVGLKNKFSLQGLRLVKIAKAACAGGTVTCGYSTTWTTCGGIRTGTTCSNDQQCVGGVGEYAKCITGSECVVTDAGDCSTISNVYPLYCSTAQLCNPLGCIASGACYASGGTVPAPTPAPAPSCDCGSQQCDYSIPTCKCQYIGCKTSTGANCIKYTCGGSSTPVYNPIGYHDSSYCDYSYGWTCDQDSFSTPLTVNFYKDGPPGTGTIIGSTIANVAAEAGVASACGGNAYHRFNFLTPDSVKDNISHTIYAQAVNIGSGSNVLLTNTPKTVTCAPACNLTYPSGLNVTNQTPTSSTFNWTPATTPGTSQLLRVGSDSTAVSTGCPSGTGPGTGCVVSTSLGSAVNTYNVTGLIPNTTYFYRIVNYKDASCYRDVTMSAQTGYAAGWWQVKDSDVMASAVNSEVPTSATAPYFNLVGTGGFPGVVIYSGTTNLNNTNVSTKGWLANPSSLTMGATYDSAYFLNSVPSSITPYTVPAGSTFNMTGNVTPALADASGYKWFKYSGTNLPLTIGNLAVGNEKIVLLVDGADVTITGNITRNVGTGFFLLVTTGKVTVSPAVGGGATPNLEGIFVSDGDFETGTNTPGADSKLWVKGTVVSSHGSVRLPRTLGAGNSTSAPYLFEYAPDLDLLFPSALAKHSTVWREIAP